MSKVEIYLEDRYICTELEDVRTMIKVLDFSGLAATIERIQFHASAMENALYDRKDTLRKINDIANDVNITNKEKLKKISELSDLKKNK